MCYLSHKVTVGCSFGLLSTLVLLEVQSWAGAVITTSLAENLLCPGEGVVYTCVSQSNTQRWRAMKEGVATLESVYSRGQPAGTVYIKGPYRFTLISSNFNHFESTVSAVATSSINNTVLECAAGSLRDTVTIQLLTGVPSSPLNTQSYVQEYHNHFSTVTFTWEVPRDNQRVEYYQYQLINETGIFLDHNTSNTSITVSGIPYNENLTLIVLAHNCIGSSSPSVEEVYIVGCLELESLVKANTSIFSQAPGSELEIVISCNIKDNLIHITCSDDGRWTPNPNSILCPTDPTNISDTISKTSYPTGTNLPDVVRDHFPLLNVVVPVVVGIALSVSTGLIIIFCTWKFYLYKKKVMRAEQPPFSGTNHLYCEINGPIYEAITEADVELIQKVKMANNESDVYQDIHFNQTNWCVTDMPNKDTIGDTPIQMENNNSYQAITSLVIVNSEVSTSKQPCCYETPVVHTLENTRWLNNNMYASQEDIVKQDEGSVLPERVFTSSPMLHADSLDINKDTFCHPSSTISPKQVSIQGEHNLDCEQNNNTSGADIKFNK